MVDMTDGHGHLIVIDGVDGAGKKTQLDLLMERLRREVREVATMDFPRYATPPYGPLIKRYLNGDFGDVLAVHPELSALLYANDRLLARPAIEETLGRGAVLLLNRYVASNLAYMCAKVPPENRLAFQRWLMHLEFDAHGMPVEDLLIFLDMPPEIAGTLVSGRGAPDIHEANRAYQEEVRREYLRLAERTPHWTIISCAEGGELLTRETIHKRIWQVVKGHLKI